MLEQVTVKQQRIAERLLLSRWAADASQPQRLVGMARRMRQEGAPARLHSYTLTPCTF